MTSRGDFPDVPATNRKNEDRQLANALRAKGYKTPREFLHDVWVDAVQKFPKFPETSCNAAIKTLRDGGPEAQAILELVGDRIMEFARPYDRMIRDELEARIRKGKAPEPSPGTKRNANGAGPSYGAFAESQTASAGPVRGGAALSFKKRARALDGIGIAVTKSLYDTIIFDGKPLGDWTKDELAPIINRRDVHSKFAKLVMEQSLTSGPLRTANISPNELEGLMLQAKASVGV